MRYISWFLLLCMTSVGLASTPKNFIIDTDVGVDDAIAMLYLLKQPDANVIAITIESDGNAHCLPAMNNVKKILQITHHESIPVACGRRTPLQGTHHFPKTILKESDTLAGLMPEHPSLTVPAQTAEQLLDTALSASSSPVSILAIGPLTTLAEVLSQHPDLKNKISRIYQMGGAVRVKGNIKETDPQQINETAEWNIYIDPLAAEQVFHSGVRITLIPLDVTNTVLIDSAFYQALKQNHRSPEAGFVFTLLTRNKQMVQDKSWYFWDPMAAVVSLHHDLVTLETLPIRVLQSPETLSGATVIDTKNGAEIDVATHIQPDAFKRELTTVLQR